LFVLVLGSRAVKDFLEERHDHVGIHAGFLGSSP
jgi:hypothetical protein